METKNEQPKMEEAQEPQGKPKVMFLEYTDWKQGQHAISAIVKGKGEKRGRVAARIFIEFSGEPKKAIYTAKDAEGNPLFPPTEKLWELKKSIKENAQTLYDKCHPEIKALAKAAQMNRQAAVVKNTKGIEKQIVEGAKKIENAVQKPVPENGRKQEIEQVRQNKAEQGRGKELER